MKTGTTKVDVGETEINSNAEASNLLQKGPGLYKASGVSLLNQKSKVISNRSQR